MLHENLTVSDSGTGRAGKAKRASRAARKTRRRSRVSPDNAVQVEAEQTPIGVQTLVSGVVPITPAERLAMRANAPMEPKKAQRAADHGLFDTNSRNQIEMF